MVPAAQQRSVARSIATTLALRGQRLAPQRAQRRPQRRRRHVRREVPVCPFTAKGDNDEKRRKALDQHVRAKKDTLHTSYRENGGTGPVLMRDADWESFIAKQPKALRTAANELREKAAQLQLGDELAWSLHALSCWRLSASRGGGDPLLPWPARKRN